jgi:hypothetical protein
LFLARQIRLFAIAFTHREQFFDRLVTRPFAPNLFQPAGFRYNLSPLDFFERNRWLNEIWVLLSRKDPPRKIVVSLFCSHPYHFPSR